MIPPGVDYAGLVGRTAGRRVARPHRTPVRVLFVGGDLERKGGLRAARRRPPAARTTASTSSSTSSRRDDVPRAGRRDRVHHGLAPEQPRRSSSCTTRADVFCLPTLGDCLPMVLSEAGAVGLPLVSTDVGAIREIVRHGETGLLVPVGDAAALAAALRRLADDAGCAGALGDGGAGAGQRRVRRRRQRPPAGRPARSPSPGRRRSGDDRPDAAHGVGDDPRRPRGPDRRRPATAHRLRRDGRRLRRRPARPRRGAGRRPAASGGCSAGSPAPTCPSRGRASAAASRYRVVFTDGEQVGIPYAALTRLVRSPAAPRDDRPRALAAEEGARCTAPCACRRRVDARRRLRHASSGASPSSSSATGPSRWCCRTFMVDTEFWRPDAGRRRRRASGR